MTQIIERLPMNGDDAPEPHSPLLTTVPTAPSLTMAQAHNFVAVALALWLVRDKMRLPWLPALLFGAGVVAVHRGSLDDLRHVMPPSPTRPAVALAGAPNPG